MKRTASITVFLLLARVLSLGQSKVESSTPSQAHVTILEFADFQCPFCARQAPDLNELRTEYRDRVTFVFKNFPLPFHKQSRAAHLAALAAAKQGKFWEMHDLIFAHPEKLSPHDFELYAAQLGLDVAEFRRHVADPAMSALIDSDIAEGNGLGVGGTPTFVVNRRKLVGRQSYTKLKETIEEALNGEPSPTMEPIYVDLAHAAFRGSESAPVTIVEFADFQCPFCAAAVDPLRHLLAENSGKVRLAFKNFPLDSHVDSPLAHAAALSAGEQGKFWEMHDWIYAHPRTIKRGDLLSFARQLNLDIAKFEKDVDNPELRARIDEDKIEGERIGVAATPTFIVDGEAISGFSAETLQAKIDAIALVPQGKPGDIAVNIQSANLSRGPQDAPIKIAWYVDLTSPLTAESAVALERFVAAHAGNVFVEFKNFPLPTHPAAILVHEFALAAAAQGKFWQVEFLLMADPKATDRKELGNIASQARLDQEKLWTEIDGHKYAPLISRDLAEAKHLGVTGTPTFIVGGKRLDGADGLASLP